MPWYFHFVDKSPSKPGDRIHLSPNTYHSQSFICRQPFYRTTTTNIIIVTHHKLTTDRYVRICKSGSLLNSTLLQLHRSQANETGNTAVVSVVSIKWSMWRTLSHNYILKCTYYKHFYYVSINFDSPSQNLIYEQLT